MSAARACAQELQLAVVCQQFAFPGECDCFDPDTFANTFEEDVRISYLTSQAFAAPSSPNFCDVANERVCTSWRTNQSCCCQAETELYRQCLFETVFPAELPRPLALETIDCKNTCPEVSNGDDGGDSMTIIIAAAAGGVALLVAIGAMFYCRRRRARNAVPVDTKVGSVEQARGYDTKSQDMTMEKSSAGDHEADLERGAGMLGHQQHHADPTEPASSSERSSKSKSSKKSVSRSYESPPKTEQRDLAKEAEKDLEELDLKAEKLRSKRDAIEHWHKDRKSGSTRSLDSYVSDEENLNDEEKERRRAERRAQRAARREEIRRAKELADKKAAEQEGGVPAKQEDRPAPTTIRRSSKRDLNSDEGPPVKDEEALRRANEETARRIAELKEKKKEVQRKLSSRNLSADGDEKMKRSSSRSSLERRSSRSRLEDGEGSGERKHRSSSRDGLDRQKSSSLRSSSRDGLQRERSSSRSGLERRSSRSRLDENGEERKSRKSSSRRELDTAE